MIETKASVLSPVNPTAESYERRLKRVIVPMKNIVALLTNDREWAACIDEWPKDARVVGTVIQRNPWALILYLDHPEFPRLPIGSEPPEIRQRWLRKG